MRTCKWLRAPNGSMVRVREHEVEFWLNGEFVGVAQVNKEELLALAEDLLSFASRRDVCEPEHEVFV